jgi:hypothetical protein
MHEINAVPFYTRLIENIASTSMNLISAVKQFVQTMPPKKARCSCHEHALHGW